MNIGKIERIEKLNSTNYGTWKIQMKSVLRYNDLWGYVTGTVPNPEKTMVTGPRGREGSRHNHLEHTIGSV